MNASSTTARNPLRYFLARPRLWILALLIVVGLLMAIWQPVSLDALLERGHAMSANPLVAVALILFQALLLAAALPGTLMLWVVAPIYPPPVAALILTCGSALGALGAYVISRRLRGAHPEEVDHGRVMNLLRERGDLLTQLTLRVTPGFPHSVVNYAAGILHLPLKTFLLAAVIGLGVKWMVYAAAVDALVDVGTGAEPLGLESVAPLLLLALFLGIGAFARHLFLRHRGRR